MILKPIVENFKDVIISKGKLKVQLEIPSSSSLSENDVKNILDASTWRKTPSQLDASYEGIRSIIIEKEEPVYRGDLRLDGLQISGIGYRNFQTQRGSQYCSIEGGMNPPCKKNFMNNMHGFQMATDYAKNGELVRSTPSYRAQGTYTASELKTKLDGTEKISKIDLKKIAVPSIEACGRFIEESLCNDEGNFGFMVSPVPLHEKRAFEDILEKYKKLVFEELKYDPLDYFRFASPFFKGLSTGLREIHDKAGMAHLGSHTGNFYLIGKTPYLVDWGTPISFEKNKIDNALNRSVDLSRTIRDFYSLYNNAMGLVGDGSLQLLCTEACMGSYLPERKPDVEYARELAGDMINDFNIISAWMIDNGEKGFISL